MSEVTKSVVTALAVVAAAGAVVAGASVRGRNDLGGAGEGTLVAGPIQDYLATKTKDIDVPAADYFYELSDKLKKEYVEPIKDDQKLATGAVRGMLSSLSDPKSTFMSKDEFQAFLRARQGSYSGIGVDLAFVFDQPTTAKKKPSDQDSDSNEITAEEALALGMRIPKVVVADVVPGGPADKAGVKPGDVVYEVDQHWVANIREVAEFRRAQADFLAKKMPKEQYYQLRNEIRKKTERALMPLKVREKLTLGEAGPIQVEWVRNGQKINTTIEKGKSSMPGFSASNGSIRLPFDTGSDESLRKAIAGKTAITIDLRNNVDGDYQIMRKCLAIVAPAGKYGSILTEKKDKAQLLTISKGNGSPPQITLLVDKTTGGAAKIFALALSSRNRARLQGSEMSDDASVREIVQLPDGSGYTLVTGNYSTRVDNSLLAEGGRR